METLLSKNSEESERFVARIPSIRRARGMSQQKLADTTGMSRVAIGKIEAQARGISLAEALTIAEALGVDLSDALSDQPMTLNVSVPID